MFSQGWAGYAFPLLPTPLQSFRTLEYRPLNEVNLKIDGNTAHSSGWWWTDASPFYLGGALYYNSQNKLVYDAGRTKDFARRRAEHALDADLKDFKFEIDRHTNNYFAQRGREQIIHVLHDPPYDKINPIHRLNPLKEIYMAAGRRLN